MLQEQRQQRIMDELRNKQSVRIAPLCEKLGVTRETVRRDLHELEKKGLLKKVHGGAILKKTNVEPPYAHRSESNNEEKHAIAKRAAAYVDNGDAIYIDIGTSTLYMTEYLGDKQNLTVVTNALMVAYELSKYPQIKVMLSGGELRSGELSLSGSIARKSFEDLFIDKAFIGVGGLSLETGITDYHVGESEIRKMMLNKAMETYALADYSKFDVTAFTKACEVQEIDRIITDTKAPSSMVKALQEQGITVDCVEIDAADEASMNEQK